MKLHQFKLANGIPGVVWPMPGVMSVCLAVGMSFGSRFETRDTNGMAHFLEHMAFKGGTDWPNSLAITSAVEGSGGKMNAFTGNDAMLYYVHVPSKNTPVAFSVLADMLIRPRFRTNDIEHERGVVFEELRRALDDFDDLADVATTALYFGDHPLGWEIVGPKENIQRFERQDFLRFFAQHYVAEHVFLAVAGNINPREAERLAKQFSEMPKHGGTTPFPLPAPTLPPRSQVRIVRKSESEQAHFRIVMRGPENDHPLRDACSFATSVLSGGQSCRFSQTLRDKLGLVYDIGADSLSERDYGQVVIAGGAGAEKLSRALRAIRQELKQIGNHGVSQKEFARVREMREGNIALGAERSLGLACYFATEMAHGREPLSPEKRIAENQKISRGDVKRAAQEFLKPERMTLAVVGNVQESEEELLEILQQ